MKPLYLILVFLAVFAVAFADVFLKQASKSGNFMVVMQSPWFWAATGMYLFQVIVFTFLFISKVELSMVGIIQTVFYAIIVLGAGYFIYKEALSTIQYVGLAMALVGVLLLNIKF